MHRKLIQPTFNQKILQSFVETFQSQSIIFTKEIASNVDGKEFDVSEIVAFRTLNFICGKEIYCFSLIKIQFHIIIQKYIFSTETTMGTSIMSNHKTSHKYFQATKMYV